MSYQDALARVIEEVIAPGAAEVDARATFPRRQSRRWARPACSG